MDWELNFKAAVYALFAAAAGATFGGLVIDPPGDHTAARAFGLIAGVAAYIWRVSKGG